MSDNNVPDISQKSNHKLATETFGLTSEDDIDWCHGFWNEIAQGNTASLYPESPIFSTNFHDWKDPTFVDNVFICPDIEDVFSGSTFAEHPAFIDIAYDPRPDKDLYSLYPVANPSDTINLKQLPQPKEKPKRKRTRTRKPKAENNNEIAPKRQSTGTGKKPIERKTC